MKLGIAVVYLLRCEHKPLLELHLRKIRACTTVDYTIYASINRLQDEFRKRLEQEPNVKICPLPATDLRSSAEHGYYLDRLVAKAVADGVSHVATLDVDSFPIKKGWAEELAGHLSEKCVAAAILRKENRDATLVFPAGLLFSSAFYARYQPKFYPDEALKNSKAFLQFTREPRQAQDTGIGFSFAMNQNRLAWHPLLRSNLKDDHYLMAGIYGDLFFHLGGVNSRHKVFRGDYHSVPWVLSINKTIQKLFPGRLYRYWRNTCNQVFAIKNRLDTLRIQKKLFADPDSYLDYLRTGKNGRR